METIGWRRAPAWPGVVAGAVPLVATVVVDPAGWYPFGPAKQAAVAVAALLAVASAGWVAGTGRLPRRVAWLWAVLLAWLALAAVVGEDRWYAWIGTPERRLGWLTWALLAVCAWAGARLGGWPGALRWFVRCAVVAGVWCGGYCLVELWWRVPVETSAVTSRLGGPFGSAAYLGAALCLLVPLAAALALDQREHPAWRVAGAFAVLSGAVGVVGSGTRAAWIALAALTIVTAVVRRPSWRLLAAGTAAVGLALVAVASRLDDVAGRAGGATSRLAEWEVAARVIASRPLLGAGPEGYRIAFADGVDADYERTYGREVLPDRAHSAVLDVATVGGLPAALLYTALVAVVLWHAWRALRAGDALTAGLGVAAGAYVAQQLLLFPLAELDPTLWLIGGALLTRPAAQARARPLGIAGSLTAALVFAVGVLGVAADRSARTALRRAPGSDSALAAAERATDLRPDVLRYHLLVSTLHAERQSVAGARAAVAAAERAIDVSPGDPIARQTLAEARTRLAQVTGDPADLARALTEWEQLVADDAHCRGCWTGLATTRLFADDRAGADAAFARARELGATP